MIIVYLLLNCKTNANINQKDYGSRSIGRQNASKIICLPPDALKACRLNDSKRAQVSVVITDTEKFIKISVCVNASEANLKYTSNQHDFLNFAPSEICDIDYRKENNEID
jgi:hypothetical protein